MLMKNLLSALVFLPLAACASSKAYDVIDPDALVGKVMVAATPGEPHADLARHAGEWDVIWKMRQTPADEWQETKGHASIKMIMGNRFMLEENRAQIMGNPWEGRLLLGFDNLTKEYVSTWCDTLGTTIITSRGTADPVGKVITMEGMMTDPQTPEGRLFRTVSSMTDDNHMVMKMWDTAPDGTLFHNMDVTYTRK